MLSVDYYKFFDSFDHQFTHDLLVHVGFPPQLAKAWLHLQSNTMRTIKHGVTIGTPFHTSSGVGQGDPLSLVPAIVFVSWQFLMVDKLYNAPANSILRAGAARAAGALRRIQKQPSVPRVKMGACIDDRNFRGTLSDLESLYPTISAFDKAAGHYLQPDKTTIHTTRPKDAKRARTLNLDGHKPRVNYTEVLIGEPVNVHYRHTHHNSTGRLQRAVACLLYTSPSPRD